MTRLQLLRSHAVTARQSRPPAAPEVGDDAVSWFVAFAVLFLAGFMLALSFAH